MSTRSRIGIKRKDGSIESIYCHWDGYLSNNGKILFRSYQDINKIEELLDLGNISSLSDELNDVVAYMRDKGEEDQEKRTHKNLSEFNLFMTDGWEEYVYLYDETSKEWRYAPVPYPYTSLKFDSLKEGLDNLTDE